MELGKVSPPESSGLLERGRLFARPVQARKGKLVWITGPAGAGKTSLVSNWAQSRGIPAVWYQLDEDDNDPATFFHYLLVSSHPQALKENQTAYPFHPIMREFLLQHLYRNYSAADVRQIEIHIAWLLLEKNEVEAAADLLCQAQAWEVLAQIIRDQAPELMASGRTD